MSVQSSLETALQQVADLIVTVTASPNPDYTVGNRSISKAAYLATLTQQLALLKAAINEEDGKLFEIHSQNW